MKIKIMGHDYELLHNNVMGRDERNGGGKCCSAALQIVIDPTYPKSRQNENLLHEIFEALCFHLAVDMPHDKMSALCEGLFAVMQDNPSLIRGMCEETRAVSCVGEPEMVTVASGAGKIRCGCGWTSPVIQDAYPDSRTKAYDLYKEHGKTCRHPLGCEERT